MVGTYDEINVRKLYSHCMHTVYAHMLSKKPLQVRYKEIHVLPEGSKWLEQITRGMH